MAAPRTVLPLTEPKTQSHDSTISQPQVPTVIKPLIQPTPASITKPLELRIDPRSIPTYHKPFLRPPPRTPDVRAVKTVGKDLQELDMDRKIKF